VPDDERGELEPSDREISESDQTTEASEGASLKGWGMLHPIHGGPPVSVGFELRRWWSRRSNKALDAAAKVDGVTSDDIIDRLRHDEQFALLVQEAIEAAQRTFSEAKQEALGRLIATGALAAEDAELDETHLRVRALAELDTAHFRVLYRMARPGQTRVSSRHWDLESMGKALPSLRPHVNWLLRGLEIHGLVIQREKPPLRIGPKLSTDRAALPLGWMITPLGLDLVQFLGDGAVPPQDSQE
jgi:hypothetical protein